MVNSKRLNLITIGYAKRALERGTRERLRMLEYSSVMNELHIIVFTHLWEKFPAVQQEGDLFLHATNSKTRLGMLWDAYRIGRGIIKNNHERRWVVSSQDPFETALVGRAVARGNRTTYHTQLHGDSFNTKSYNTTIFQKLRAVYGRYVVRHTKFIRVVSERLKQSLLRLGVKSEFITVLPIQADLAVFLEVGKNRVYPDKKPLAFLYVGRFSSEKNLPLMIDAFKKVSSECNEITLTLLGSGPLQSELENKILKIDLVNKIKFVSWTDDVSSVMSKHDVLCLSSDHEGWAMVLLEAAAAGMPVITTDVGCAGEVIIDDKNGKVVSVGDIDKYVEAFRYYCNKPEIVSEHGQNGFALASARFLSKTEYLTKLVDSYPSYER